MCGLLDLPRELRDEIYTHILALPLNAILWSVLKTHRPKDKPFCGMISYPIHAAQNVFPVGSNGARTTILATNQQINLEAKLKLYAQALSFFDITDLCAFLESIEDSDRALLRSITVGQGRHPTESTKRHDLLRASHMLVPAAHGLKLLKLDFNVQGIYSGELRLSWKPSYAERPASRLCDYAGPILEAVAAARGGAADAGLDILVLGPEVFLASLEEDGYDPGALQNRIDDLMRKLRECLLMRRRSGRQKGRYLT